MAASLRGQRAVSALLLGLVTLVTAGALVCVTTWMGRDSVHLWQAGESVRAAAELEIALLLHNRERRLLEATGRAEHARAMREAEARTSFWLEQARSHVGGPLEAGLLEEVTRETGVYFTRARSEPGPELPRGTPDPALGNILALTGQLVHINVRDARNRMEEAQRWDHRANLIGLLAILLLLTGIGVVLWAERRLVYRPVELLQRAIVGFQLGASWRPAPEVGAQELRNITRAFNDMAARLERQREVQVSFLAGVAHDLRNPIQALKLAVSGTGSGASPPERAQQRLALVERQVERLGRMVNDLLDTTRI
ncbi:MAG TPA: HAMP domain-containing sensor histidine kinase, partial [Archangium sp.]|nr:HAMP domain-containing sensor histidine kinase [Archangium sp.]